MQSRNKALVHPIVFEDDVAIIHSNNKNSIPIVSIICVNYFSDERVLALIDSFKDSDISFECVIIDNSVHNRGYASAVNKGFQHARGNYVFVLNPDCLGSATVLRSLISASEKLGDRACIAPQLIDIKEIPYLSTTGTLGWWQMVTAYSVLDTLLPKNPISQAFWYRGISYDESRFVESASGAALFLHRKLFESVGGFDERYQLYFEDSDFCRRLRKLGILIWYDSKCKVVHERAGATPNIKMATTFFRKSRWIYSKTYFGLIPALFSEGWLRIQEAI